MLDNNHVKRIGSFMVALSWVTCLICFFVFQYPVKAEAAEEDSYWINVMDYGGFKQNGETYGSTFAFVTNSENRTFGLALPSAMNYQYIDMVIYTSGGYPPSDLSFTVEGNSLNVQKFGQYNNYWRLFGQVSLPWGQSGSVIFTVSTSYASNQYMEVLSCRISRFVPYSDLSANWSIYQDSMTSIDGSFPSVNAADWPSRVSEPGNLRIQVPFSSWLFYDHVDLFFLLDVSHIDGITACLVNDNGYIPVSTNYLNNASETDSFNMLSVSLDLSNVLASKSDLRLYITFHTEIGSYNNFILYSIHGWRSGETQNPTYWWLQKILGKLNTLYSPPAGATPPQISDSMQAGQDFIQDGIGQVDQELDVIATIPRPDLGSIDLPSDHLDSIDYNSNVAHLTMLTHSQPFRLIFFFAALFMVVGVVVYGRRS